MEGTREDFLARLAVLASCGVRADELVFPSEHPLFDKYDAFIPAELLRKAYARDRLDPQEVQIRLDRILSE
jgi:ATP-dependent Lhr-like helicase